MKLRESVMFPVRILRPEGRKEEEGGKGNGVKDNKASSFSFLSISFHAAVQLDAAHVAADYPFNRRTACLAASFSSSPCSGFLPRCHRAPFTHLIGNRNKRLLRPKGQEEERRGDFPYRRKKEWEIGMS
jgi:hypothetical protein